MSESESGNKDLNANNGPLLIRTSNVVPDKNQPDGGQYFEWGHVRWIIEADLEKRRKVSVGEICFYPGKGEPEHSHFGEEQILHIVSGQGEHFVNGERMDLKQGDTVYIPPYSRHLLNNTSARENLILLATYVHSYGQTLFNPADGQSCNIDGKNVDLASIIDLQVVGRLLNKLSLALNFSLRLLDANGAAIIQSDYLLPVCRRLGECGGHCLPNIQKAIKEVTPVSSANIVPCCDPVHSIWAPIISENIICGFIKCGEFFINPSDQRAMSEYLADSGRCRAVLTAEEIKELVASLTIEKKSHLFSISEVISGVAVYIAENSLALARQRELDKTRLSVAEGQMVAATLEKALREADFKLLQSQINPHFLFNTLSMLSQLAYMEGADKTAGLVCSLSGVMRATLRKSQVLIPLAEEISLVHDYLNIQATRFGDRFTASVEVEEGLDDVRIPILMLQPLVENVIVHAVEISSKACSLAVRVKRLTGGFISLTVTDDGPGFSGARPRNEHSGGLGLLSIKTRLQHFFSDRFTFEIDARPGQGVEAKIVIPESLSDESENISGR